MGPPIARPGKIVCIGLNYRDHAAETNAAVPLEPVVFLKDPATVVGPYDDIVVPRGSIKTDWEVELGVVIGRTARYLGSPDDAPGHIAGYVVSHDVSERDKFKVVESDLKLTLQLYLAFRKDAPELVKRVVDAAASVGKP